MKFFEAVATKLKLLEAGDITAPVGGTQAPVDAAMPNIAPDAAPTPEAVDDMGANLQAQTNSTIKMCTDIINALVVFMRGKFADQVSATPGLGDQLQDLEQLTTVTDVEKVDPKLLQSILSKVSEVKGS